MSIAEVGKIYLSTDSNLFYSWNPNTGATDFIGTLANPVKDVAIAPDGRVFGIDGSRLYLIDAEDASMTLVGPLVGDLFAGVNALTNASGFDIGADGVARVSSSDNDIAAVVDLDTGAVNNPFGPSLGFVNGGGDIWINDDGSYFVSNGSTNIVTVAPTTTGGEVQVDNDFLGGPSIIGSTLGGLVSLAPDGPDARAELIGFIGNQVFSLDEGEQAFPGQELAMLPVSGDITGAAMLRSEPPKINSRPEFSTLVSSTSEVIRDEPDKNVYIVGYELVDALPLAEPVPLSEIFSLTDPDGPQDIAGIWFSGWSGSPDPYQLFYQGSLISTLNIASINLSSPSSSELTELLSETYIMAQSSGSDYRLFVGVEDTAGNRIGPQISFETDDGGLPTEAPTINDPGLITVQAGATGVIYDLVATDDEDTEGEGGGLFFSRNPSPDQLNLGVDLYTGEITFNRELDGSLPEDANDDNIYELTVAVTDSDGLSSTVDLRVQVVPEEPEPELLSASPLELEYFARVSAYGREEFSLTQLLNNDTVGGVAGIVADGWEIVQEFLDGTFRAVVLEKDGYNPVLAFRGTEGNVLDWLENASTRGVGADEFDDAILTNLPGQNSAVDSAELRFADWLHNNPSATFTGHSQGGAQAQLAIEYLLQNNIVPDGQIITFNSPGINRGVDSSDYSNLSTVTHYVSAGDIVSQAGIRFTPGNVIFYDYDAAPEGEIWKLVNNAHTGHWAQIGLYTRTPEVYGGDLKDVSFAATPNTTETLSSLLFSQLAYRPDVDGEFAELMVELATKGSFTGPVATLLLSNRFFSESTRGVLSSFKEGIEELEEIVTNAAVSTLSWEEENSTTQISVVSLSDDSAIAEVVGDTSVVYSSDEPLSELAVPTSQSALITGTLTNLDQLTVSGYTTASSLFVSDYELSVENVNIIKQSAIIQIDADLDGILDSTITLSGNFNIDNFEITARAGGTEIRYLGNALPEAVADSFMTLETAVFTTGNVLLNDIDGDTDELSVVGLDATGTLGNVTDNGDGTFDYNPNGAFDSLLDGETATDTFMYLVSDGTETVSGEVSVTISGEGTLEPVLNPIIGTAGSNNFVGTDGADVIRSLGGSYDRMTGGNGADEFIFGSETSNGVRERDVIMDFELGVDSIVLESGAEVASIQQTGGGVMLILSVDGDAIYLRNDDLDLQDLSAILEIA